MTAVSCTIRSRGPQFGMGHLLQSSSLDRALRPIGRRLAPSFGKPVRSPGRHVESDRVARRLLVRAVSRAPETGRGPTR